MTTKFTVLNVELKFPERAATEDDFSILANTSIEFIAQDDVNAPIAILMDEAIRTLITSGEIVNRIPELAPNSMKILAEINAEESNA